MTKCSDTFGQDLVMPGNHNMRNVAQSQHSRKHVDSRPEDNGKRYESSKSPARSGSTEHRFERGEKEEV